jgi:PncC family amidohydrolase
VLRLSGVPESEAAARLDVLEETFPPELSLSYLPRRDGLWLELSVRSSQEQAAAAGRTLEEMTAKVAAIFAAELYATDESPLSQLLLSLMDQQQVTLAVAESITGGRIAAELVGISGASRVFRGGVTAYATAIKESLLAVPAALIAQHGVVSAEVAMAMAEGVRQRLGADFGLATTGYAEAPEGGQAEVWIGFASESGQEARQDRLVYDRTVNLDRATQYALQFCFEKARQYFF